MSIEAATRFSPKRTQRVVADHLVLVRFAAVAADEIVQLVHVEHREADVPIDEIAAAALHRHHPARLAGQRIGQVELRARVAAAEVRDAQVGTEQVRSVSQKLERFGFERGGFARVPEIFQIGGFNCLGLQTQVGSR